MKLGLMYCSNDDANSCSIAARPFMTRPVSVTIRASLENKAATALTSPALNALVNSATKARGMLVSGPDLARRLGWFRRLLLKATGSSRRLSDKETHQAKPDQDGCEFHRR